MPSAAIPIPGLFSYTGETMEDLILARLLADVQTGFYVDVGACLPTAGSVTKHFYDRLWRGINIEPLPDFFGELCRERPRDINLNVGISNVEGPAVFHACAGLSTLSAETAARVARANNAVYQDIPVTLCTLNTVFDTYVRDTVVHFLKIDVETHEREVLESLDFCRYKPWVLCIESTFPYTEESLHEEWEDILDADKYVFLFQHSVNRYYAHKNKYHERYDIFQRNDFIHVTD